MPNHNDFGRQQLALGNFDEAICAFEVTLRSKEVSYLEIAQAYHGRGHVYLQQGAFGKAISDFTKQLVYVTSLDEKSKAYADRAEAELQLATLRREHACSLEFIDVAEDLSQRIEFIKSNRLVAALTSEQIVLLTKRGSAYFKTKREAYFNAAHNDFDEAISLSVDPHEKAKLYVLRGTIYYQRGQVLESRSQEELLEKVKVLKKAIDDYSQAVIIFEHDAIAPCALNKRCLVEAYQQRSQVYLLCSQLENRLGNMTQAIEDMTQIIRHLEDHDPAICNYYISLGKLYFAINQLDDAKNAYVQALERSDSFEQDFDAMSGISEISKQCDYIDGIVERWAKDAHPQTSYSRNVMKNRDGARFFQSSPPIQSFEFDEEQQHFFPL